MYKDSYPDDPAALFINRIVYGIRNGSIRAVQGELEDGPPDRAPDAVNIALHQWFHSLGEEDKDKVLEVVRRAIDQAQFSTLVLLDGATGGRPIRDRPSDLALYLQAYDDEESLSVDHPTYRRRVNHTRDSEGLHDKFMRAIMEANDEDNRNLRS
jgi:hypothetical protein